LDDNLNSNLNDKKGDTAIALFLFFFFIFLLSNDKQPNDKQQKSQASKCLA